MKQFDHWIWIDEPFSGIDFQILRLVFDGFYKILPIQFEWSEIKKYIKVLGKTYEDFKLQDIQNSILYRCQSLNLYNIILLFPCDLTWDVFSGVPQWRKPFYTNHIHKAWNWDELYSCGVLEIFSPQRVLHIHRI